ncbi:MAG: serine/threonine-protein kinase [Planctomycetaceae bacterium]
MPVPAGAAPASPSSPAEGRASSPVAAGAEEAEEGVQLLGLPQPAGQGAEPQDPLDLVICEYLELVRRGEQISPDEFASRFPKRADEIRELLQAAALMESWRVSREQAAALRELPPLASQPDVGGCRLVRELGRGGMGVVYEAVVLATGERVALKLMSLRYASDLFRARFRQEARVTARLRHPHIVPVHTFGEEQGWCYYTMRLIDGLPLDKVIARLAATGQVTEADLWQGPSTLGLPGRAPQVLLSRANWSALAEIIAQAAAGLAYAHEQAILHRDIKPGNLMLDHAGQVLVTDFGVALDWETRLTRGRVHWAGTLAYLAPEVLEGRADERSDIYSLGATLYELCTLVPAYRAPTNEELVELVGAANPCRPRQLFPALPVELERIILRAMARVPAQRYRSALEFEGALRAFARQSLS